MLIFRRITRLSPLFCLFFLLLTLVGLINIYVIIKKFPQRHRYNASVLYTPRWLHPFLGLIIRNPIKSKGPPHYFPELMESVWPGDFPLPELAMGSKIQPGREKAHGKLMMLHIFSTGTTIARKKRDLIRRYSPLLAVAPEYHHLIEVKFILGRPNPDMNMSYEVREEEKEIEQEMSTYGDIVRLEGLKRGDNMNNGKTWEWLRWVGREGAESEGAWWVMKCDDDTIPIVPNILKELTQHSAETPTYFGSSLGHWMGYHYYFEGMLYGFSWGVVKSVAAAKTNYRWILRDWDEDARTGQMMFSLPSAPHCRDITKNKPLSPYCDPQTPPPGGWIAFPPSPDLRTGLVRLDLGYKLGDWYNWWTAPGHTALAIHRYKSEEDYIRGYEEIVASFRSKGREYMWDPPKELEKYASTSPPLES